MTALQAAQVQCLFTLSGNQIMPVFDASLGSGIRLIHVRHEAAAVHMADAWGRLTGQPGVALVTAGPGMANCLSALYVARMAESPLLLLSGQSPLSQRGRSAFQEMAQAEMALHVSKASWTADASESLTAQIDRGLRIAAQGRPGPVHIGLPFDLLEAASGSAGQVQSVDAAESEVPGELMARLVTALADAERPLILTGPALMRGQAVEPLEQLAALTGIPVIGMESPRGVNDPSLGALAEILPQADLVLLWGKKLDFTLRLNNAPAFSPDCQFLQVDCDEEVLQLTTRVLDDASRCQLSVQANPLAHCLPLLQAAERQKWQPGDWAAEVQSALAYRPPAWRELQGADERLHPVQVCRAVQQYLDGQDGSVFVSDGGEFGQWAQACIRAPRRIINGAAGSIGVAIPFALAARLACPESRVVTLLGDGTFGFHPMEFDTAVRYELPFIAVVGNDALWNAEYQIQLRKYGADRAHSCELLPTRYDQLVTSLGGHGALVTTAGEMTSALDRAERSRHPSCLNVSLENAAAPVIRRG